MTRSDVTGVDSGLLGSVFLLVLRRTLEPVFDADTADEHDSDSDASSSQICARGCVLLLLRRVASGSLSDTEEQQDSRSDSSASCVDSTRVDGCCGLWSLEALVDLLIVEVDEPAEGSPSFS